MIDLKEIKILKNKSTKLELMDDLLDVEVFVNMGQSDAIKLIQETATKNKNHSGLLEYYSVKWDKDEPPEVISRLNLSPIAIDLSGDVIFYSFKNKKIYQENHGAGVDKPIIPEEKGYIADIGSFLKSVNYA